jgi:hypothetical protein
LFLAPACFKGTFKPYAKSLAPIFSLFANEKQFGLRVWGETRQNLVSNTTENGGFHPPYE